MAVFTEVPPRRRPRSWPGSNLGTLVALDSCAAGIENTNYFADTDEPATTC